MLRIRQTKSPAWPTLWLSYKRKYLAFRAVELLKRMPPTTNYVSRVWDVSIADTVDYLDIPRFVVKLVLTMFRESGRPNSAVKFKNVSPERNYEYKVEEASVCSVQ